MTHDPYYIDSVLLAIIAVDAHLDDTCTRSTVHSRRLTCTIHFSTVQHCSRIIHKYKHDASTVLSVVVHSSSTAVEYDPRCQLLTLYIRGQP